MRAGILAALLGMLAAQPALGDVFLRVSTGSLPPAKDLGVVNVVFVWPVGDTEVIGKARALGYRVFLEAAPGELLAAADFADQTNAAGLLLDSSGNDKDDEDARSKAAGRHPALSFLRVMAGGKEPQMRGRLVVERNGILQVSSPSSQPWVDTNLALVKFARSEHPRSKPLYSFHWDLSDAIRRKLGPAAEEYELAIAESQAFDADVVMDLHEGMQQGLAKNETSSWTQWNRVKRYLEFQSPDGGNGRRPLASAAVVSGDERGNYESVNLLARHNIPFVVLRPEELEAERLQGFNTLVVFCPVDQASSPLLNTFANGGGLVVIVNQRGDFPWHSSPETRQDARVASYKVGSGEIVEFQEPVSDPEAFAKDVRRWMGAERAAFNLWNSLTTVVVGELSPKDGETILNLVNYSLEPESVQVQVKGHFATVRYESPEEACCKPLAAVPRDGVTEFVIPALRAAGRVHLRADSGGHP